VLVLGGGSFSPGQVTLTANMQAAIDKIIPLIKARSLDNVVVEGHATKGYGMALTLVQASKWNKIVSLRRANAVAGHWSKKESPVIESLLTVLVTQFRLLPTLLGRGGRRIAGWR